MRLNSTLLIFFSVIAFALLAGKNEGNFNDEISTTTISFKKKRIKAPAISNISNCEGVVTISGTIDTPSPATTTVRIYMIDAKRMALLEDFVYLKSTDVDAGGNWKTILIGLSGGEKIKVSGEDLALNTSEFSSTSIVPLPFFVEASQTNVVCYGNNDGAVDVVVSGGVPPYDYQWAHGPKTKYIEELSGGIYGVTISDQVGCSVDLGLTILGPAGPLAIDFEVTKASCITCSNGSINATVTGGVPNYRYEWSNDFTTEDLQALDSGIYCLTVTDANGCVKTSCATISVIYFIYDYGIIQDWNIYPNPAKNSINIQLFDPELLGEYFVVRDLLGKEHYNIRLENMVTNLDITLLETGAYIVSILTDRRLISSRLVVDK